MDEKQNIYAELTLRAIKDGTEWQSSTLKYPLQSKETYTMLEKTLTDALIALGYEGLKSK